MSKSIYNRDIHKNNFLNKSKIKHNNKYDYSLVEYINSKTKVKIICPIHGTFEQLADNHRKGYGCTKCSRELEKQTNTVKFINTSKITHNNKYSYSKVKYNGALIKVKITCPIHGDFIQKPNDHLNGQGCRKCQYEEKTGIYNLTTLNRDINLANKDSTLYMIQYDNLIKIGLTTQNIICRFY